MSGIKLDQATKATAMLEAIENFVINAVQEERINGAHVLFYIDELKLVHRDMFGSVKEEAVVEVLDLVKE